MEFSHEEKTKVLQLFKPDTNCYKTIHHMLYTGNVHNWEFRTFTPTILSYRDVIYFIKKAIDEKLPALMVKRYNKKGKDNYWTIERRENV